MVYITSPTATLPASSHPTLTIACRLPADPAVESLLLPDVSSPNGDALPPEGWSLSLLEVGIVLDDVLVAVDIVVSAEDDSEVESDVLEALLLDELDEELDEDVVEVPDMVPNPAHGVSMMRL